MKGTTNLDLARILRATPQTSLTGSGIIDKLTKSGVAGSPYHVDFKTRQKLLTNPETWKTSSKQEVADMNERVAALKRSYHAVHNLGFKGSYTSFAKTIGAFHKPAYTFPGFGSGKDIHKAISKLPKPKAGWTLPGHKYTGPYNDLENQVRNNTETSKIIDPPWQCSMTSITRPSVVITRSANMKQIEKW